MADDNKEKKYYWLKLPRNFFAKHYILMLMAHENGKDIVLFYIRLLTESIDHEGRLRYSEKIPYTPESLAALTGFPLHTVTEALQIFAEMELVVTESDGTLFLPKCLKMIGSESESTQRVRDYRRRKKEEQKQAETVENTANAENRYKKEQCNKGNDKSNVENRDKSKSIDNKKDIVGKEPTPPYKDIIDYLNLKTDSKYKHTTKATQRIINGRFKEGFTLEDFKTVIDVKSAQWKGDKKMAAYLRPETLFAASHFESYLNEGSQFSPPEKKHPGISERLAAETSSKLSGSEDFGDFN